MAKVIALVGALDTKGPSTGSPRRASRRGGAAAEAARGGQARRSDRAGRHGRDVGGVRGSLAGLMPFGDANAIVLDMAREVLPVVKKTPVPAGSAVRTRCG